jgi:hypothetical protein
VGTIVFNGRTKKRLAGGSACPTKPVPNVGQALSPAKDRVFNGVTKLMKTLVAHALV